MAKQNDVWKRYLDAGIAFTEMTRSRAEAIVKDLVRQGDLQQKRAGKTVDDLMDRSRRSTEQLVELIRGEVRDQLSSLGIATKDDIARLEARIGQAGGARSAAKRPAASRATAKKAPARKAPARKAPAKKAATARKA